MGGAQKKLRTPQFVVPSENIRSICQNQANVAERRQNMDYTKLAKGFKKRLPLILSFVASAGVVATTVTALKVHPKKPEEEAPPKEKAVVYLKTYGPTLILAASTIACIFGAHAVTRKSQATLASAYTLLYSSYNEYKDMLYQFAKRVS